MITHENVGFSAIDRMGLGDTYLPVIVIDAADGPPIPNATVKVVYFGKTYLSSAGSDGTTVIAVPAPPGTSLDVSATAPGYDPGSMSITTMDSPSASPMGIPLSKATTPAPAAPRPLPLPFATPYSPKPIVRQAAPFPGTRALTTTTDSNLPIYLALGGVGIVALIVVVLIARS
jgi:hypothetical protein